jgi:hypothetical protein
MTVTDMKSPSPSGSARASMCIYCAYNTRTGTVEYIRAGLAIGDSEVICVSRESGYDEPFWGGGFLWQTFNSLHTGILLRILLLQFSL